MPQLQLILRELEELKIPRFLFLNKIDKADTQVRESLEDPAAGLARAAAAAPDPDLEERHRHRLRRSRARARLSSTRSTPPSEIVPLEGEDLDREKEARFTMLETLADHDDELMEQLLEDIPPPRDRVFDDLAKELRDGLVCPVLMGVATRTNGVLRLLKALRHEAPGVAATAKRLGVKAQRRCGRLCAQDLRTPPMAASSRWRACWPARSATAPR